MLETLCSTSRVEHLATRMDAWLALADDDQVGGFVVVTEYCQLSDLAALEATLKRLPHLPVLLVVGGRGLVGCEGLLSYSSVRILPDPWTPSGLENLLKTPTSGSSWETLKQASAEVHRWSERLTRNSQTLVEQELAQEAAEAGRGAALGIPQNSVIHVLDDGERTTGQDPDQPDAPAPMHVVSRDFPSTNGTFPSSLLNGAVDTLRDPLALALNYLEMFRQDQQNEEQQDWLDQAVTKLMQMDQVIQAAHLAATSAEIASENLSMQEVGQAAVRRWTQDGQQPGFYLNEPDAVLQTDRELLQAALDSSYLFLERFGPDGKPQLRARQAESSVSLIWELPMPAEILDGKLVAPPDFLSILLQRIAGRLGAEPVIDRLRDVIPIRAGLRWKQTSESS